MVTIVVFAFLQLLASGYACWRGGAPERWIGVLLVLAFVASLLTPLAPRFSYGAVNVPMLQVDLVLLIALVAVALAADRFWPMWIAALQLATIAAHGIRLYDPHVVPGAYWWLVSKAAYPMIAILIAGTVRHRGRLLRGMPEYGWTLQRLRHGHDCQSGGAAGR